ncbi:MAG: sugar porter family MFS transporter [Edaphobacter sp.]
MSNRLILAAGVCSLGGLTFGYDLGALSAATQSLREQFGLSPASFGLTVSLSLWGTICGALLAGRLADIVGRHRLIAGCSFLYALASVTLALSFMTNWNLVLLLRFLSGIAIGGLTVGCPLYLAELAPNALRGRFVSLFQLQVAIGVALGFSTGSLFAHLISANLYWRWCFAIGAVPACTLLLLLRFMPEEPRWLAEKGEWQKADAIAELLGLAYADWQSDEKKQYAQFSPAPKSDRLFSRKYVRPILLATSIAVFNQLSGANILLLYLLDVLSSAGVEHLPGHTCTVVISCLNVGTTLLGMMCVDKVGRKPLLVWGSAGMSLCLFALGLSIPHHFAPVWYLVLLVVYDGFFAFSQGTVIWVYLSELFPSSVRGAGQGYGTAVLWIATAVLVWAFPVVQHGSSVRSFYFFALMMILQIVVVIFWYPETKGKALGLASTFIGNIPK